MTIYREVFERGRRVIKKIKGRIKPKKRYTRRCSSKNCTYCAEGRQHKHKRQAPLEEEP